MSDIRYTQATSAYDNALKAAENILHKVSGAGSAPQETAVTGKGQFFDMIGSALDSAVQSGYKSEAMATRAIAGKADIADVVTAISNAETALNTVVAIRDRVINAYQDIIKMPI